MHLVPQPIYQGVYPTQPLTEASKGAFHVTVDVLLWAPSSQTGSVSVRGSWSPAAVASRTVHLVPGDNLITLSLTASPGDYYLWWPNGMGPCSDPAIENSSDACDPRPMYTVNASWAPTDVALATQAIATASRRIGFRVVAFVTRNDTNADPVGADFPNGTGKFTMRFRVNGASMYARGANMIPMETLEGRANATALQRLVHSAAEANFNFLRIWGGGMFLYDAFYDACDEDGILLFHDMMYAQQGHSPHSSDTEHAEIVHQIRRLAPHPCMAIFDGCNECNAQGEDIYVSFVMQTVANTTQSIAVWPSCPALGWEQGVHPLTTLPTGSRLVGKTVASTGVNDSHGPYVTGNGWQTDQAPNWHVGVRLYGHVCGFTYVRVFILSHLRVWVCWLQTRFAVL